MTDNYKRYMNISKIKDMEDKIENTKKILDICCINKNISYDEVLKLSQYLDKQIVEYYKLKNISRTKFNDGDLNNLLN